MEDKDIKYIGRITKLLVDKNRKDFYSNEEERKIPISIFYPSDDFGTSPYDELYNPKNELLYKIYGENNKERIKHIKNLTYSFKNNSKIKEGKYKVVVFSHGLSADRDFFMFLIEPLVKAGFICITVGHLYDTDFTLMPESNKVVEMKEGLLAMSSKEERMDQIKERVLDLKFVIDSIDEINSYDQIHLSMEPQSLTLIGHSLGGMTVFNNILEDKVKNIVMLDASIQFMDLDILKSVENYKEKVQSKNVLNIRRDNILYEDRIKNKINRIKDMDDEKFKKYLLTEHEEALEDELSSKYLFDFLSSSKDNFVIIQFSNHLTFTDYFNLYNDKDNSKHSIIDLH